MQNEEEEPLMADQIAKAIAEGKLEEFLQNKMPDNEYAKALTMMMLKMTGMSPSEGLPSVLEKEPEKPSTIQPSNSPDLPIIEKDTLDQLNKIASENNVNLDWIVLRALRVYVQEYLKTGRL
jgi:hypothetical protein